ncbi:MAG: NAD(+) synthase [Firmicutes bacterium]|nr:NAD(+) synthase [Bacillota bacterium]
MKDGFVKIAAAAVNIRVADTKYNAKSIINTIKEAAENRAKLVVLPELCVSAYTCGDLFLQQSLIDASLDALFEIAEETAECDIIAVVGVPICVHNHLYNCAAVINRGEIKGLVPKLNIPNYGEFYEARHFFAGGERVETLDINGCEIPFGANILFKAREMPELVLAVEICEDLWTPIPPSCRHALAGATVIANLSASNEITAKDEYREQLAVSQSARLYCAYVYANAGGGESTTDLVFSGDSIIAENGAVLARSKRFADECVYAEADLGKLLSDRRRTTTYKNEGYENYVTVYVDIKAEETELSRYVDRFPFVPGDDKKREKRCEEILSIQAGGFKKRLEHTGCKNAVIGVSGGLDSTLALLVTARAFDMLSLDRRGITAVTMPCFGTTDRTRNNAVRFAESIGAELKEINITDAVMQHFRDIGQSADVYDVTYENSQARERTQILMDLANKNGGMVIGTGDMSEIALGWATYNGDHMSMYAVNVGVPKTLIRYLVDYEAQKTDNAVLKETLVDILNTPVSPELLPPKDGEISQKTEHIVGPYELHDFFLYHMIRFGSRPRKILRLALKAFDGVYDREFILGWMRVFYKRFFSQQFKRSCIPDGPKVGTVALSPRGDWRMPSDASVKIWMDEVNSL